MKDNCFTRFCLCPPQVYFPVLCNFWQLYGGVNGDLLQEGLCHTQVCCTQSPCPEAGHCWPLPPQETFKHSSGSVSVGSLGPGVYKVCLSTPSISGVYGFDSKCNFSLLPSYWGFSFALGCGVSIFGRILHSPVEGCLAASCNFEVLTGDERKRWLLYGPIVIKVKNYKSIIVENCGEIKVKICKILLVEKMWRNEKSK